MAIDLGAPRDEYLHAPLVCPAAAGQTRGAWYVIGAADTIITPESELFVAHRAHAHILMVPGHSPLMRKIGRAHV